MLYSGKRSKEPLLLNILEVNHIDDNPSCFEEFDIKDDDDDDDAVWDDDVITGHVVDDNNAAAAADVDDDE